MECKVPGNHTMKIYASETMTLTLKMHSNGLVTCTLEYLVTDEEVNDHKIANDVSCCKFIHIHYLG